MTGMPAPCTTYVSMVLVARASQSRVPLSISVTEQGRVTLELAGAPIRSKAMVRLVMQIPTLVLALTAASTALAPQARK